MTLLRLVGLSPLSKFLIVAGLTFLPLSSLALAIVIYISAPLFDTLEEVVDQTVKEMMPLHKLQNSLLQAAMPPNDYLIHGGSEQERRAFKQFSMQINEAFDQVSTAYLESPRLLPHIEEAQQHWQQAKAAGLALMVRKAGTLSRISRTDAEAMEAFDAHIEAAESILRDLHHIAHKEIIVKQARVEGLKEEALYLSVTAIALAIFLGIGASLLLARQQVQAHAKATHDALTGLYTRGAFNKLLNQATQHTITYEKPGFALMLLDIDDFREINERYGTRVGDAILQTFTETAKQQLRASDIVARQGGDRFTILLADSSRRNALELAERLRTAVENEVFSVEGQSIRITTSIGIALFPDDANSPEKLDTLAEKNLQTAKQRGGNCIHGAFR